MRPSIIQNLAPSGTQECFVTEHSFYTERHYCHIYFSCICVIKVKVKVLHWFLCSGAHTHVCQKQLLAVWGHDTIYHAKSVSFRHSVPAWCHMHCPPGGLFLMVFPQRVSLGQTGHAGFCPNADICVVCWQSSINTRAPMASLWSLSAAEADEVQPHVCL